MDAIKKMIIENTAHYEDGLGFSMDDLKNWNMKMLKEQLDISIPALSNDFLYDEDGNL
jgi:hypothetical protein